MKKAMLAVLASVLWVPALWAASSDVMAPIRQFIDGFNTGDTKSAFAAYAKGDIIIIDEFTPYHWSGPDAAHAWADGYEKHATATGVTDGSVKYGSPTRTEIEGDSAYVILPATYLYKEHGKPMVEKAQLTVVLRSEGGTWKISGWTWTGEKPHAAK
jgi:hypothetical protein